MLSRICLSISVCLSCIAASAQTATVLYSFTGKADGTQPIAALIQASDGNFYGTATGAGYQFGSVFQITPAGKFTLLHTFTAGSDNANPLTSLVEGSDGYLYGTTSHGSGAATVFQIKPSGEFTTIHTFCGSSTCPEGDLLNGALIPASDGYLYGNDSYSLFRIAPGGAFSIVTSLNAYGGLVQARDGNFYGSASTGGANDYGGIFKLTPSGSFTLLNSFACGINQIGCAGISPPNGALVEGSDGNFYAATLGIEGVIQVTPKGPVYLVYAFCSQPNCADGGNAGGNVMIASDNNLYGVTTGGGKNIYYGDAYQLTYDSGFTDIYDFTQRIFSGYNLAQGSDGNFYATSQYGGEHDKGTIYKLSPAAPLEPPVQLNLSSSSAGVGQAVTMNWTTLNAFSLTMQQCDAFVQNSAAGAGTWTGKQPGQYDSATTLFTGSATITPTAAGTYTYALTCGGIESGFATLTVTAGNSTTTTLSATPAVPSVGQSVTLTATITGSGATPTGTVTFSYGSNILHTATLNAGVASFTASTNGLPLATYALTAKYSGDANYTASSGTDSVKLAAAPTTAALTVSPDSVTRPTSVTLTATVTRSATGAAGTPTGSVTFYANGSDALATVKLNSSGVASITSATGGYSAGKYAITAKYLGDTSDATSTSSAVDITLQ